MFNAVVAEGDFVGQNCRGARAGAGPTASAVVADLIDIARGRPLPTFAVPAAQLKRLPASPMERHRGAYYVRLMVVDRPGVIADVTAALRDEQVSLESMLQRGRAPDEAVPVVLTTHETEEALMRRALDRIAGAQHGGRAAAYDPDRDAVRSTRPVTRRRRSTLSRSFWFHAQLIVFALLPTAPRRPQ